MRQSQPQEQRAVLAEHDARLHLHLCAVEKDPCECQKKALPYSQKIVRVVGSPNNGPEIFGNPTHNLIFPSFKACPMLTIPCKRPCILQDVFAKVRVGVTQSFYWCVSG